MLDLIADIRKDYRLKSFSEADADRNAIKQFEKMVARRHRKVKLMK